MNLFNNAVSSTISFTYISSNVVCRQDRRVDIELRMQAVQLKLDLEQDRRAAVERSLRDVERECREPFVVPALLKAFIKISQLGDAVADGTNKERPGQ